MSDRPIDTTTVYGLYETGEAAQAAVDHLRAAGVTRQQMTIITPYPMDAFEFFHHDATSTMWWNACIGGFAGLAAATTLLWIGETSWPLDVGGLPIFAWWPNLIIMFELTMLGAIVATVGTLLVSAELARPPRLHDEAVSNGLILVGVNDATAAKLPLAHRALATAAAVRVITGEPGGTADGR